MFNANSYLVKIYVRKIKEEGLTFEVVPSLFNLKEVVTEVVNVTA
ncbi:hypothetical protein [Clostridium mobile]|nr:hypothetical protein [Clostridium mobile]